MSLTADEVADLHWCADCAEAGAQCVDCARAEWRLRMARRRSLGRLEGCACADDGWCDWHGDAPAMPRGEP